LYSLFSIYCGRYFDTWTASLPHTTPGQDNPPKLSSGHLQFSFHSSLQFVMDPSVPYLFSLPELTLTILLSFNMVALGPLGHICPVLPLPFLAPLGPLCPFLLWLPFCIWVSFHSCLPCAWVQTPPNTFIQHIRIYIVDPLWLYTWHTASLHHSLKHICCDPDSHYIDPHMPGLSLLWVTLICLVPLTSNML